ncbi:MAG: enoyl-CoA hydratase/isomerase family protein [Rhizobiaceae bacterium]|nr:enoyl-CoA hydratase/isomerase family protein [Rhizobiaceae bacterium]
MFELRFEEDGAVASIELRRPPANAIGPDQVNELSSLLDRLQREHGACRVVLFHAAGRFFSAGGDIKFMAEVAHLADGPERLMQLSADMQRLFGRLEGLPLPTVCALSGTALGGGLELALACDIRVAEPQVIVGLPEVKIGLLPGAGGTQRVSRLAGPAVARRLILTGDTVSAAEAMRLGLLHEIVPAGQALNRARAIARGLAASPPRTLAAIKRCIGLAPSAEGLAAELEETLALQREPATKALIGAFVRRSKTGVELT